MKPTARFWTYHYGAVLIKMKAGQTLRHHTGGPTDEGWSSESLTWTFDGATVGVESVSDGVDCDGRLTRYYEACCSVANLDAGNEFDGLRFPAWEQIDESQRDYSAEAAGY